MIEKTKAMIMIFDKGRSLSPGQIAYNLVRWLHNDSLLRNSIYIMSTMVITSVFGYLYWIVATHFYSAHDVGLASAVLNVMALASIFADMGISTTLVQMLPSCKAGSAWSLTLNAGLAAGTLFGLFAGIVAVVILPLLSPKFALIGHNAAYILIFIVGVPLWIVATLLDQTFVAERATVNMLIRNTAFAVLKLILMALPILLALLGIPRMGPLGILASYILALMITLIGASTLLVPRLNRAYCLAMRGMIGRIRTMLSSFVGHHSINIGAIVPAYLLTMFVTIRLSAVDNAYFSIASMVSACFFMISPAVATSLFAEGSHTAKDMMHKARFCAVIISLLLGPAMLAMFLGGRYVLLLFGPNYAQHGLPLLMVLIITAVPDAITNIYVSILRVQRRLRCAALINLGNASLTLALAWILLPMLGIVGAGWALLISDTAWSLIIGADFIYYQSNRLTRKNDLDSMAVEKSDR
jgi:O-antigen/teichoic acid export membrane protein